MARDAKVAHAPHTQETGRHGSRSREFLAVEKVRYAPWELGSRVALLLAPD